MYNPSHCKRRENTVITYIRYRNVQVSDRIISIYSHEIGEKKSSIAAIISRNFSIFKLVCSFPFIFLRDKANALSKILITSNIYLLRNLRDGLFSIRPQGLITPKREYAFCNPLSAAHYVQTKAKHPSSYPISMMCN